MHTEQGSGKDQAELANSENLWHIRLALVLVSPLLAICVFAVVVCLAAIAAKMPFVIHEYAPWALFAFATIGFVSAMKERVSHKRVAQELEARCTHLQHELAETKQQVLTLEEGLSFHQSLEKSPKLSKDVPAIIKLNQGNRVH
ncbi:MAG: hypothetical protein K2X81_17435 [Candidatus Obscuribacterales bacterium]|nr:hypothetical protein [Candidatus Obscuribacterales bacterium]